jgi:hypothetical protein
MRLYRKAASYWDGIAPHEVAHVRGRIETLTGELLHYTSDSLSDHHRRSDVYASLGGEALHQRGQRSGGPTMFVVALAAFVRTYLIKQGFRDGVPGLIIAMSTAYSVFMKFAKVWEKNQAAKAHKE